MSIRFSCPSCGAAGCVDDTLAGKQVRCKHCKYHFAIPSSGGHAPEVYALEEPTVKSIGSTATSPVSGSTFVPRRGAEPTTATVFRKVKAAPSGSKTRPVRQREWDVAWRVWLIRLVIGAVLASAAISLFAPHGTRIVGCLLLTVGSVMVLVGFGAGAYGAFREDFLYGFFYVLVPLYAAYYLVTRWDDLRVWFACSTAGVVLVTLGTQILQWSGVGV